jgi:hypothetical protein
MSTIQDILSILVTSIYDATEMELDRKEVKSLVTLANFMSGTQYRDRPFVPSGRGGTGDLRFFLRNAKKYTELINSDKYELEDRNPIDFLEYVTSHFKGMPIKVVQSYKYNLDKGNARQVFEFSTSGSLKEKIESYTKVFYRVRKCPLPQTDNLLMTYYIIQSLRSNLDSVYDSMVRFLAANKVPPKPMIVKYTKAIKHIASMYSTTLKSGQLKAIRCEVDQFDRLVQAPYGQQTFMDPEQILHLLRDAKRAPREGTSTIASYKEMIMHTLLYEGEYMMPDNVKQFYTENGANLLNTNILFMKNNVANGYTLRSMSRKVYSLDRKSLAAKIESENGDCRAAERFLHIYDQILS